MKDLEKTVKKYPFKPWNWDYLTVNANISIDFILKTLKNKKFKWNIKLILKNPNATLEIVEANFKKVKWCMNKLSRMITVDFHDRHPELEYVWGLGGLSNNPNITPEFVKMYPDKDWDYGLYGLSRNPNMDLEFFLQNKLSDPSLNPNCSIEMVDHFKARLSYPLLSKYINPEIVDHYITKKERKNWNFNTLSINKKLNHEFVEKYIHEDFDWTVINIDFESWKNIPDIAKIWKGLSSNPNITLEFIENHIDMQWDYSADGLSGNPIMRTWFIKKYSRKHWAYGIYGLSDNPGICEKLVKSIPRKSWYYPSLSKNPGISAKYILYNSDKNWNKRNVNLNITLSLDDLKYIDINFHLLSMNKSLTHEMVDLYIDNGWNWVEISRN